MVISLETLSENRKALMGCATIGVLACHAAANDVHLPSIMMSILGLGQIGVDIFFFLSGFGLFYSLSKDNVKIGQWYRKRFLRIFVPYIIIYSPALLLTCVDTGKGWHYFLYNLSTLSFWFGDDGCWFISVLAVFYLIAPFWKSMLDKSKFSVLITFSIACVLYLIDFVYSYPMAGAFSQGLFFFVGMLVAKRINGGGKVLTNKNIIALACLFILLLFLYSLFQFCPLLWILFFPFIIIVCVLLDYCKIKLISKVLDFMGNISLESYLLNVTLIVWIDYFSLLPTDFYTYRYAFIVGIGIILSYIVNKLSIVIVGKILAMSPK